MFAVFGEDDGPERPHAVLREVARGESRQRLDVLADELHRARLGTLAPVHDTWDVRDDRPEALVALANAELAGRRGLSAARLDRMLECHRFGSPRRIEISAEQHVTGRDIGFDAGNRQIFIAGIVDPTLRNLTL
jgi:hypothetical protein